MNNKHLRALCIILFALVVYVGCYASLVEVKGFAGQPISESDPRAEIYPKYKSLGIIGEFLFIPLHLLDKLIRPDSWYYVLVIKDEFSDPSLITVQDYKKIYYPENPMIGVHSGKEVARPDEWFH
ncbi:MAG: hypothetical protein JJU00_17710 [Opitutales bacterium]|nr:hypothetical protein [Opitutales bacterium]